MRESAIFVTDEYMSARMDRRSACNALSSGARVLAGAGAMRAARTALQVPETFLRAAMAALASEYRVNRRCGQRTFLVVHGRN